MDNVNVCNLELVCVVFYIIDVSNVVLGLILNLNLIFDLFLVLYINYEYWVVFFGLNDCGFCYVIL